MTGGPERRDESVTFSLRELTKLEDERIEKEKQTREARAEAAEAAREAADRRERATLEARERAAAEERARARRLEVEEEARREAMSRAAVEQARIEVEARTRAEESDRERRHELELQRLRLSTRPTRGIGALLSSGLGGAVVGVAGCLVVVFAVTKPASDRRIQDLDRAVATAEGRASALERRVEEQSAKLAEAQGALEAARDQAAHPPTPAPRPAAVTPAKPGFVAPPSRKPPAEGPCVNRFDPLCGHIP
jgi:hypothetical protein